MKRIITFTVVLGLLVLMTASSYAITIGFDPVSQDVLPGTLVDVELVISGLGDFAAPSLGEFDLDISFDSSIIAFNSISYGDPILGDQLDPFSLGSITETTPGIGVVSIFELSFDLPSDLNALQPSAFTLATLTFDALAPGTSSLDIGIISLGDTNGSDLAATTESGSVTVVPEPATVMLIGSGLIGLAGVRRRLKVSV